METKFNLRQFLTENKLTSNSKQLNEDKGTFFKATVNVADIPVDYGYTLYAEDEEEAKVALDNKIKDSFPGKEYSIKKLRGPFTPEAEKEAIADKVDMSTIELDGVDPSDYPDFSDAFIASAQFNDGRELTDDELDQLTDELSDDMHQMAYDSLMEGLTDREKTLKEQVLKTLK